MNRGDARLTLARTPKIITHGKEEGGFESLSHACVTGFAKPSSGVRKTCKKQYNPRKRESTMEDLQTVRHSSKDGAKGKRSGIIKTQQVIEKRNEVKSL